MTLAAFVADLDAALTPDLLAPEFRRPSSINECFDDLPIREVGNGTPVPWRSHQDR
jgi:hypothetical protein